MSLLQYYFGHWPYLLPIDLLTMPPLPPSSNLKFFIYQINIIVAFFFLLCSLLFCSHFVLLSYPPGIITFPQLFQFNHFLTCKPQHTGKKSRQTTLNLRTPSLAGNPSSFFWLAISHSLQTISRLHTCPQDCNFTSSILTPSWWICLLFHRVCRQPTHTRNLPASAHIFLLLSFNSERDLSSSQANTNAIICALDTVLFSTNFFSKSGLTKVSSHLLITNANRISTFDIEATPAFLESLCPF